VHILLMLLTLLSTDGPAPAAAKSSIEATIRGISQPVKVELLLRDEGEQWQEVAHRNLGSRDRDVRFDNLEAGVYQLRVSGQEKTEQFATKVVVGANDLRQAIVTILPFELTGRVTISGTEFGVGGILLHHKEFSWRAAIPLEPDGTFHAPLWQRGSYMYSIKGPAVPTSYAGPVEIDGKPVAIDIPEGRITGIVRDRKSGTPAAGVSVSVQTRERDSEQVVHSTTNAEGRFDFFGMKEGEHTVRVFSPRHIEPEPVTFTFDRKTHLRELDVRLDRGRTLPLVVVDPNDDPILEATVLAVAGGKLRARAKTDEDGRTSVAVPEGEEAMLFVIPSEGGFAVVHVKKEQTAGRIPVRVAAPVSSLTIHARTVDDQAMPPLTLLMRYNGDLVPPEVARELATIQGLTLTTDAYSTAHLQNIPSGDYEFWPYRTDEEAASIAAAAQDVTAPIAVNVHKGENRIAVKFAAK
jgi:hypothetical protein